MSALHVGYARRSTDQQDLTAQRDALLNLRVEADREATRTSRDRSRTCRSQRRSWQPLRETAVPRPTESPTVPTEGAAPAVAKRSANVIDVY